jgi:hypothetical protein
MSHFNGCRRVNISKDRLTGIEWEMILWHGFNHFLLKFPVRIFLGHWDTVYANLYDDHGRIDRDYDIIWVESSFLLDCMLPNLE